jgi:hypothetical protein
VAKPALDAALAALNSITQKDIVSLKALKNPPDVVKRIFDCVLLLRYMPVDKASGPRPGGALGVPGMPDDTAAGLFSTSLDQSAALSSHRPAPPAPPCHNCCRGVPLGPAAADSLPLTPPPPHTHTHAPQVSWQDVKGSMVILGTYPEAVKMMGDMNFLSALVNFPKEQINDETVELLKPYFAAPDFNYDSARKASGGLLGC